MITPANDYVLLEIQEQETADVPVITPDRAKMMQPAVVVELGPDDCILTSCDRGFSAPIKKSVLVPGIAAGKTVNYRKIAEDRTNADAAYRQKIDGKTLLLIKISDILSIQSDAKAK